MALLCLIAVRPSSAYELVGRVGRSVGAVWPRARSNLYTDVKRLAAEGLAAVAVSRIGRRRRSNYTITERGLADLQDWLASPGAAPQFECEALVKLGFAEQTTKESALSQISVLAGYAAERIELGRRLAAEHLTADGPLSERLHINAVMWRFLWDQHNATARWADWARAEIETWPDTAASPVLRERGQRTLREAIEVGDHRPDPPEGPAVPDRSGGARRTS